MRKKNKVKQGKRNASEYTLNGVFEGADKKKTIKQIYGSGNSEQQQTKTMQALSVRVNKPRFESK